MPRAMTPSALRLRWSRVSVKAMARAFAGESLEDFQAAHVGPFLEVGRDDGSSLVDLGELSRRGRGRLVVGRSERVDILIPCEDVSRFHCRIELRGGVWTLRDLRSRNGTWIGESQKAVREVSIAYGATFRLGDRVRLRLLDSRATYALIRREAAADESSMTAPAGATPLEAPVVMPRRRTTRHGLVRGRLPAPGSAPRGLLTLLRDARSMGLEDFQRCFPEPVLVELEAGDPECRPDVLRFELARDPARLERLSYRLVMTHDGQPFTIGRAKTCDLTIDDKEISRHHVAIERRGEVWTARDLGSANGLVVGPVRVKEPVELGEEVVLRLGDSARVWFLDAAALWRLMTFLRSHTRALEDGFPGGPDRAA